MPLFETFALTITTALAKHMLSQWLGSTWQTQVGQDFLELLRDKAIDKTTSREAIKQVDAIAASIVSQMDPWVKTELRNLSEDERRAALIEVAHTLALIDANLLVSRRLNADYLMVELRASRPDATRLLSEPAVKLYERIIEKSTGAIVNSAPTLPGYTIAVDAAQLNDNDRMLGYAEQTLNVLNRQQEDLLELREALKRNADPYADYLATFFNRINEYLNHTFGITSRDVGIPLDSLQLRYRVVPGLLNPKTEIEMQADPLLTIIGKRFEETQDTFNDLHLAFLASNGRLLLLGEPGAGKTISLLKLALDAVHRRMRDPGQPLPILGVVPTWDYHTRPTVSEWLKLSFGAPHDVETVIDMGQALLLLDGLDELVPQGWDSVDPQALFVKQLPPNNQIVLTCRTHTIEFLRGQISLSGTVAVQQLSDEQILEHLIRFPLLRHLVHESETLRDLLRTPFFFSLFVETYHDASAQTLAVLEHSGTTRTRHEVLHRCILSRYDRGCRQGSDQGDLHIQLPGTFEDLFSGLCDVAYKLVGSSPFEKKTDFSISDFPYESTERANVVLRDALRLRLVVRSTQTTYRFSHLLFRDYFAFERAKGLIGEIGNERGGMYSTRGLYYVTSVLDHGLHKRPDILGYKDWFVDECVQIMRSTPQLSEQHTNTVFTLRVFEEQAARVATTLLNDPDPGLRFDAVYILSNIDSPEIALEPLIQLAKQEDGQYRSMAIEGLARIPGNVSVGVLLDLLSSDFDIALSAAEALIGMGQKALGPITDRLSGLDDVDLQSVKQTLDQSEAVEHVSHILMALDRVSNQSSRLLVAVYGAIVAPDSLAKLLAEKATLTKFDTDPLLTWLFAQTSRSSPEHALILLENEDREVRLYSVQILGLVKNNQAIEPLVSTLADPDEQVSIAASHALISVGPPVLDYLDLLGFPSSDIMEWKDDEVLERLLAMARDQGPHELRHTWLHGLVTVTAIWCELNPEYIPELVDFLSESDSSTRFVVANSLIGIGNASLEPLVHAFEAEDEVIKSASARILEYIGVDMTSLQSTSDTT